VSSTLLGVFLLRVGRTLGAPSDELDDTALRASARVTSAARKKKFKYLEVII